MSLIKINKEAEDILVQNAQGKKVIYYIKVFSLVLLKLTLLILPTMSDCFQLLFSEELW